MNTIVYKNGEILKWSIDDYYFHVVMTDKQISNIKDMLGNSFSNINLNFCSAKEFALICKWIEEHC